MAAFLPQEMIRAIRDKAPLSPEIIPSFINSMMKGEVSEGQIAAFLMAIYFQGLNAHDQASLTRAMRDSGMVLNWCLEGPVVDKHSTGGVGDKTSLMLAPILAAAGAYVPMIAGRGLGHTGGTIDKLESIPGYNTAPNIETFQSIVRDIGCAIIGQTPDLAPADAQLYAIRDVTATVESTPLITASILSKKLAAGLDSLVMNVTFGNGAFMPTFEAAKALAENIMRVAGEEGTPTHTVISDMNQPLGHCAGNAVEVAEAIAFLKREPSDPRQNAVTYALATEMLISSGLESDEAVARQRVMYLLESGKAAKKFAQMVHALGGPIDLMETPNKHLPQAAIITDIKAEHEGIITAIDTRAIGIGLVAMKGGRSRSQESIDPAVGICHMPTIGQAISRGQTLATVHAQSMDQVADISRRLNDAITCAHKAPEVSPPVIEILRPQKAPK